MRKKIALQFVSSNLATLANFMLVVILARLLTPTDVGIFSMSAVLIAVAHVFRDFGVTTYLKREKEVTSALIRSALGLLIATSWTVAALLYLSSGVWARFFAVPAVADVVEVLALGFVFIPFGAIPQALLTRNFQVERSAAVVAVSTVSYFSTSVLLAWNGFAHMTMAWANLVNILVSGIAYHVAYGGRLSLLPSTKGWKRMLNFGAGNLLAALLKAADNALPDVALGRMSSPATVGLFSRANATVNMVAMAVNPTIQYFTLPYLAQIYHAQGRIAGEFLRTSSIVNCLVQPTLLWIALMGKEIVLTLFGSPWLGSVDAIPWLCATFSMLTLFTLTPQAVASVGRPMAAVPPMLIGLLAKVACVLIVFESTLQSFSIALFLGQLLAAPSYLWINRTVLGVSTRAWLVDAAKMAIPLLITGALAREILIPKMEGLPSLLQLLLSGLFMLVLTAVAYTLIGMPIRAEMQRVIKHLSQR